MSKILTIIVTFNAMRWIERCFDSLEASSLRSDIFVVDNGSSDGTREWLAAQDNTRLKLICSDSNLGFGAANNLALSYMLKNGYEFAYLLNQDAWIERDCFERLIAAFDKDSSFGILSPVQLKADLSGRDANFSKHCGAALESCASGNAGCSDEIVPVRFVMAAHWMLSRACVERVGGFSPSFELYGEDENYIDRAKYFGFGVGVVPSARAVHDRAQRNDPLDKKLRIKFIGCCARVSDPSRCPLYSLLAQSLRIVGYAIKNRSCKMLAYLPELVRKYPMLVRNRKLSKQAQAFL